MQIRNLLAGLAAGTLAISASAGIITEGVGGVDETADFAVNNVGFVTGGPTGDGNVGTNGSGSRFFAGVVFFDIAAILAEPEFTTLADLQAGTYTLNFDLIGSASTWGTDSNGVTQTAVADFVGEFAAVTNADVIVARDAAVIGTTFDTGSSAGSGSYSNAFAGVGANITGTTGFLAFRLSSSGLGSDLPNGVSIAWNDVTLNAVPEPGSLALLGLGGLMLIRRRR